MTSRLNPYITFAGNARQAMEFYKSALGGELAMNTFAEFGNDGPDGDKIMHANLETPDGFTLMASDTPPGMEEAERQQHRDQSQRRRQRQAARLLGPADRGRQGHHAARTTGLGGRVRPVHGQVRDPVDGQHRGTDPGVISDWCRERAGRVPSGEGTRPAARSPLSQERP